MLSKVRRALLSRAHLIVISGVLERDLIALGFKLRDRFAPHGQTFVHPKGHELWLLPSSGKGETPGKQPQDKVEDSGEDALLTELRDKTAWLESMRTQLLRQLAALEKNVRGRDYAARHRSLLNEWNFFDDQLRKTLKEMAAYEEDADAADLRRLIPVFDRLKRVHHWADSGEFFRRMGALPSP